MAAVYFDNNATTPLDSRVREVMLPWLTDLHGNASSIHQFGRRAREAVEHARCEVAALIGARAPEIVFLSSGTEANNGLLWDVARRFEFSGHLVIIGFEEEDESFLAACHFFHTQVLPMSSGYVPIILFRNLGVHAQTNVLALDLDFVAQLPRLRDRQAITCLDVKFPGMPRACNHIVFHESLSQGSSAMGTGVV